MDAFDSQLRLPAVNESLSDAEYDRLAHLLGRSQSSAAMNPEEMDGFFAALICAPELVSPGDFIHEIWGGGEVPFALTDDIEELANLVFRHWNFVARQLASKDLIFIPLLESEEGEEVPRGNRWANGFVRGMDLTGECWKDLFATDDRFANLLSVFALIHECDPDPELRTWKTPPDEETRKNVLAGLTVGTQRIYDYFGSQRLRKAKDERSSVGPTKPKIGRNDPCYCGSGKKYKRCCGDVILH